MIIFLIVLIVIVIYVQRWSMKNALKGIEFDYESSSVLVEPDEQFEILTILINRSRRIIPFLNIEERMPEGIKIHSSSKNVHSDVLGNLFYIFSAYLMPKQKLVRNVIVSLPKRGRYFLRGANLSGGDFLGIDEKRQEYFCFKEVVVYPKEAGSIAICNAIGGFLGDVSVRRFVIEDPILTTGFREYTGREAMKTISWTQSARTDRLMVKQFDYTTDPLVTVLLNVECESENSENLIECCFSLTRTTCRMLEEHGIKYDFFTNATTSNAISQWSYIGEGLGKRHFFTILEGLGRAYYTHTEPFLDTIKKVAHKATSSRSIIVITPFKDLKYSAHIQSLSGNNLSEVLIVSAEEVIL